MTDPSNNGENTVVRNEKGQIVSGVLNPAGKPVGTRHLTTLLEEAIKRVGEGTESYDVLLIKRVLKKAIVDGDMRAIGHIWDRMEGRATQPIDLMSGGEKIDFSKVDPKIKAVVDDFEAKFKETL